MKQYIGTKIVKATPMNRLEYNTYRGWELPANEDGADEGYLVEYTDGGKPNHPGHDGYISWSPKEQFDNAYSETNDMSFGMAVEALTLGKLVARQGWNGKGMFLIPVDGWRHDPDILYGDRLAVNVYERLPFIAMKTADNKIVPWSASQTDILATDWVIV